MNVLFVASECVPFVKTGGLADVIGSLPKALQAEGMEVRVIIPNYQAIPTVFKEQMKCVYKGTLSLGWRKELYVGVLEMEYEGIHFYFIDNEDYFGRDTVYGYLDSFDEAERYIFFSKAVLEILPELNFCPDILHLHDWQTAMIPVLLKAHYKQMPYYRTLRTVFTIHNLKYQGNFPKALLGDVLELDETYFHPEKLEYYGRLNFMKGGLIEADRVTTVSETYANEIQTPFFGEGLHGILRKQNHHLVGILNGINDESYNPIKDKHLLFPYEELKGKKINKKAFQVMAGLPDKDVPMIAVISRFVEQKGLDLILHILEELLSEDIQFVMLGNGETKYEAGFSNIAERYPDKFSLYLTFDEGLARKIYAASDMFLMPSLFEPCGLSQLIALRYQSVPIVRETGGLKDTIQPFNEYTNEGNGFSFTNYNAHDMLHTIRYAVSLFYQKEKWKTIIRNGRDCDFSWKQSSLNYIALYEKMLPQ